ncbi:MAG: non-ribosomal peptide synthase/polyketide synthase [Pseudomonadota bacterium]
MGSNDAVIAVQLLIEELRRDAVRLWLEGGELRFQAPKGAMTPERIARLRALKPEVVAFLREAGGNARIPPLAAAQPRPEHLPLSFAQERLWLLDRLEHLGTAYHIASGLRLSGRLDEAAFERALGEIVRRHEALRTRFALSSGGDAAGQVIDAPERFALERADLSALPDATARESAAREHAGAFAHRPFDLARGPLFRALLLRLAPEQHIAVVVMHHIVSDGWSLGVLVPELGALYAAFAQGQPSPLPQLPVQYADYALWQRGWLRGEALRRQVDYWKQRLAGAPAALDLPLDHPRPPEQAFRGANHEFMLPKPLVDRLQALAQAEGATLFMVLLAAFQSLLARWSGQQDVVVGTPVAGRTHRATEGLIGFFVNMLALRTDLSGDPTFRALLARVKETALDAFAHQHLPFEKLVEELRPARDRSRPPVFQVQLALQNYAEEELVLPGLRIARLERDAIASGASKLDLSLFLMDEGADGLAGMIEYASDLFEPDTMARFAAHYRSLLDAVAAEPDRRLSSFLLLDDAERHQVLVEWNSTQLAYEREVTVVQLVERQVERTPDVVAVAFEDASLTYAQLNARANQLAHWLRAQGVGPDVLVGVQMARGLDVMVALLGILKAGGAYLPLDPNYPAERIQVIVDEARPLLVLKALDAALAGQPAHNPESRVLPDNLSHVIYTSGSTGRPKGVSVRHGAVSAFLAWVHDVFDTEWLQHVLASTSLNFDISVFELFAPLTCGGTVWMVPNVLALVQGSRAASAPLTLINTVPSAAAQLERSGAIPASVKVLNVAGEPLPAQLVRQVYATTRVERIYNLYGPSEDTTYSTWALMPRGLEGPVPIGRPIANSQAYLLDEALNPVPAGVAGELYMAGDGLARGYLHRPDLTAERFLPDPFGPQGSRMYRTGDLARWRRDGTLDYIGRIDHQVKIRGFRIELGEIEAVLAAQPGVAEALVLAREDVPGDKRLVAYVATKPEHTLSVADLRSALAARLPGYMVPAHIVLLEAMPTLPNGKVNRAALPAPDLQSAPDRVYEAPQGDVEEKIAAAWARVLGVERIGRQDNFFELGGHSLSVVRLMDTLRQDGVALDVHGIFSSPTLAGMAAQADAQAGAPQAVEVPPNRIPADCTAIVPDMLPLVELSQAQIDGIVNSVPGGAANVQDIYPLATLQEGILFQHMLQSEGDDYILRIVLGFRSQTERERFLGALQQVIQRHDILRSAVRWQSLPRPVQVVQRSAPLQVRALAPQAGGLARLLEETDPQHARLDLTRAPLIGAVTAQAQAGEADETPWLLALQNHHIVIDHLSVDLIVREVELLLAGRADQLQPSVPYRGFVAQALAVPPELHESHFRDELGDVEEPTAPFGMLRVREGDAALHEAQLEVPEAEAQRLRQAARRFGVSPGVLFHLAWAQVLARCSGQADVVFGTVLLGRSQGGAGAGEAMGMFINTLPLRVRLQGRSVEEALRGTQAALSALLRHEQASPTLARRASGVDAALPLFTTLLNFRHSGERGGGLVEGGVQPQVLHAQERTHYPLAMVADDFGAEFSLLAQVAGTAVDPRRICAYMRTALEDLARLLESEPRAPMHRVGILPPDERRRLLVEWNRAAVPSSSQDRAIHQLFEEQARRSPDAVALVHGQEQLTYVELDARANQLAHRLREFGVGPERLVGICLERGLEMVISVLAVLKAGGAYLPLDPAYPKDRLAYMLEDAKPAVLLTTSVGPEPVEGLLPAWASTSSARTVPSVLCLDSDWQQQVAGQSTQAPDLVVQPEHLAYVIYTSGSTGRPKGVRVEHRSLSATLATAREAFDFGPADRAPSMASFAFDIWLFETLLPLLGGGSVRLVTREQVLDLPGLVAGLAECTVLHAVPALMRGIAQEVRRTGEGVLHGMRRVFVGGDAVAPDLLEEMRAVFPAAQVRVLYGPTEAAIICAAYLLGPEPASRQMVGRSLGNAALYVLDADGAPAPVGAPGELCLGGASVARDYLGRPELTAERFVADPFAADAGARLYRTGDRVRWLADGNVEYLGRFDNQVKLRGFRIELGEIEAVLQQDAQIHEAIVLLREDEAGDRKLVAYVVGQDGELPDIERLRQALKARLPEYMVPSAFVVLEALPLSPNGKVDRKALPAPSGERLAGSDYVAPETPTQRALAAIWADVLKVDQIGVHDNFFELGGHSLLATRVVSQVAAALGRELPLRELFQRPRLGELAAYLDGHTEVQALAPIALADRSGDLPLSYAQQRLWFLDRYEPQSAAYNIPMALRLEGAELDVSRLQAVFAQLVARHESLRTVFEARNGQAVQVVRETLDVPVRFEDLSELPQEARQSRATQLLEQEAGTPFDLGQGPLLRVSLLKLGEQEHILLLTMHHIVSDGWSMSVLVDEVAQIYRAYGEGRPADLPPLAIQYADYAVWQRERLQGDALQEQLGYWREQLAGAPALLELPTDRPRPTVRTHHGAVHDFELPARLTGKLKELAQARGATLFMLLQAAFTVLLHRLSGQDDISIGTPIAGRNRAELEGLIGFFVNALVLRSRIDPQASFDTLLEQTREAALGAYAHQEMPFEQLVEHLNPERSQGYTPLFQVMFGLQNAPRETLEIPGLRFQMLPSATSTAKFDLTCGLVEEQGQLYGSLEYNTHLFDPSTVARMAQHYEMLLQGICDAPAASIKDLPLLTQAQERQLLVEWNATEAPYPQDKAVHQLFEEQARRNPDAVALAYEDEQISYAQLDARANQLAYHLVQMGVGPQRLVGICMQRSPDLIVGLLAVLKAGAAYVPMDPAYPAQRLQHMLQDSAAVVVLVDTAGRRALPASTVATVLHLRDDAHLWAQAPTAGTASQATLSDQLAYVIYTSGSTGQPKGVLVEHRSLCNLVSWHCKSFGLGEGRRSTATAGVGFDASTWETWPPLCSGGTLVLPPARVEGDAAALLQWWRGERLDVSFLVTPMAELAFSEGWLNPGLKVLLVGGDRLRQVPRLDGTRLVNNYGPTETTVVATSGPLDAQAPVVHIGRPIANTRIYVLDAAGRPAPVGVAGEIFIGGDGVARGYLNQPQLTAERFVQDPFHGGRMYRTGDLGRWLADGNIEYLGRLDSQVKLRGFRIELGEIEAALQQQDQVGQAVVLLREDDGDQRLVAYVVGKGDAQPDVERLQQALKARLPEYMVPGAFVVLQALPLTPNGKVDTKALPAPDAQRDAGDAYVAPATHTERALAAIWAEVLRVGQVGVNDNFFALGGHSLVATRVASQIAAALGRELPLRELFKRPRLGDLAAYLDGHTEVQARAPIALADRSADLPLSYAQQRLWFLDRYEPQSPAYNIPIALRLQGAGMDAAKLQAVFGQLVARHESLRTVFDARNGQAVQVIRDKLDVPVRFEDLSGLPEETRQARAQQLLEQEAGKPFDLAQGPLLRVGLLKLAEQEHVLLLTMHHIVSDGWSMDVLVNEVARIYRAHSQGEDANLPPLPIQYADYAVWQRQRLQGALLQAQLGYWKRQLADAPALLELPTDRPRPAVLTHRGAEVEFQLGEALTARLKQLARTRDTTLFMLTHAAFAVLLHRLSGQDDICVGTPIAGRNRAELEGLIGFFANTLVLRSRIDPLARFETLLSQSRDVALGAYAHQEVPFEQLVEHLNPPRGLSHTPLFQVMFILRNTPREALDIPGLRLEMMPSPTHTAKFDLTCSLVEGDDRLYGGLEYNTDLFDEATMVRLAQHFEVLLQAICQRPATRIADLPLLTPAQRRQVLVEWNATDAPYPLDKPVHQLFEEQVRRSPETVALEYEQEQLTYAQLNARANRLAHHLMQLGVGPDRLVGICVQRSVEMVVAVLAALKAGGAYLLLDPGYPRDRLAYMLADARPQVLLAQEGLLAQLPAYQGALLCLDRDAAQWSDQPPDDPPHLAQADHLVYLIYTSGSTGVPKGVGMPHKGLANLLHWQLTQTPQPARTLQFAALGFDVTPHEIFSTLTTGGTLVLLSEARRQDLSSLAQWLDAQGVQRLFLPYAALNSLCELWRGARLAHVQDILTAGEQLRITPAIRALFIANPQATLHNYYGPTETHCGTGHVLAAGTARDWEDLPPIGRALANTRIYILDAHGQPVPPGVTGEIYIAGAQVARAYLGRPALTAERFICAFPSGGVPGERMYKTGDLGRWREGGVIDYLGRNDLQVKIRGFRIELGEIEARLAECEGVREAVVAAREDQPGDKRLVAYVVAQEGAQPQAVALRAQLARSLPDYMVPGAFVMLEALPLSPNGKLDRKALPAPSGERQAGNEYVAPGTPTERALAAIWAGVLQVDSVGLHDNFFELGGHSLLATRVVSQIATALGRDVPLRELFHKPRLGELAASLDSEPAAAALAPIGVAARTAGGLPLSYAQQRLWFLDNYEAGSAAYNMGAALRLRGRGMTLALLRGVFNALVTRHEALRTVFREVDGEARQVILQQLQLPIRYEDLSGLPEDVRQGRATQLLEQEAGKPFALGQGPLLRVGLLKLGDEEHILLLTMHHIVSDGWSMGVLVDEVAQIYRAHGEGHEADLPPLSIQYADYAVWQRERLQGDVLQEQLGYWREQLAGAPALLELPTDRPRPALQSHRGAVHGFELPVELTVKLNQLAQARGATLFMLLQSAFAVLLHRLSGQDDICVGTPIAGRNRAELEGLIGFFVNTLVLRNRIDPRASFDALLEQSKEVALAAYAHQEVPFEQLVEHLNPPRSQGYTPLFQVMFMLQNAPRQTLEIPGLSFEMLPSSTHTAKFDLSCSVVEGEDRLYGTLEYKTELFDEATMSRLAQHYAVLLQGICEAPNASIKDLPLLTQAQQRQILVEWNDTAMPVPQGEPVHQLFAEQARRNPDAIALVYEQDQLTYAQLDAKANQLARHLMQLGVGPDVLVGICMERSVEMVVGLLAVLKAGGAYVPLDPAYPAARLEYMLGDAKPAVLLTTQSVRPEPVEGPAWASTGSARTVYLDRDWDVQIAPLPAAPLPNLAQPQNLAYVIYTSGSTGVPKGVGIPHAALANHTQWMQDRFPLAAGDRVLQKTPFSFDASVWEFWSPLAAGATLVLAEPGAQRDPARLAQLLRDTRTTVVQFVPALLAAVLEEDLSGCSGLRRVFVGGEALPAALAARCRTVLGAEVVNLYGPTEACIDTLFAVADASTAGAMVPIGRPVANARAYVLDAHLNPVPVGVAGELYLAGPGLARGYLHQPPLSAERFLPDPFGTVPGARMYRTGDLARWLPDGTLDYLGRADQQVKVRGFRIELGEIEAVLRQDPRVAEALVVVREDTPGDRRLVAYVVSEQDELDAEQLRQALTAKLPDYMVPTTFVLLPSLPLTPSGKVDRNALPAPGGERQLGTEYVAPETDIEKRIAAVWAEVLQVERVGLHDNFFELGGHSLLALALVTRLREQGLATGVKSLFTAPTVAGLAHAIAQGGAGAFEVPPNRIDPQAEAITPGMLPLVELTQAEIDLVASRVPGGARNVQDIYPLSPQQEGLLFHHLLDPEHDAYVVSLALAVRTREQLEAVAAALQQVLRRHDILRTAFLWEGLREPVQVVLREASLPMEQVELDPRDGDILGQLQARFGRRQRRMDVGRAPLVQLYFARDAAKARWVLLVLNHHMVCDHVTMEVVMEEAAALLLGRADALPPPLPFRNLVAQARRDRGQADHEAFFRQLLGNVTQPSRPFGLPAVQDDGSAIEERTSALPPALAVRIRHAARTAKVSAASLFHFAWALVLARASGQGDVVFGTVLFGRMAAQAGADRAVGLFTNTLPFRIDTEQGDVMQALQQTHAVLTGLLAHEHASLVLVQRHSQLPPLTPLFSALLNYRHTQTRPAQGEAVSDQLGISMIDGQEGTHYPLLLTVDELGEDGFLLGVQVRPSVGAEHVCGLVQAAIESIVDALEGGRSPMTHELEVLAETDRGLMLREWNATAAPYPRDTTVHQLFEEQARCSPDAVALVCGQQRLTYAQLDAQANQLAHRLQALGVGPEVLVGICMERGPRMVVALLAVLKAGGAYVPLDPAYRAARLEHMLDDAKPAVLLTTSTSVHPELVEGPAWASTGSARTVYVDRDWDAQVTMLPSGNLPNLAQPGNLAYTIYTSGSTGRPKGTQIPHRAAVNLLATMAESPGMQADDVLLAVTSLSFDIAALELFLPLTKGASVVIASREQAADASALKDLMLAHRVTAMQATPSTWRMLQAADGPNIRLRLALCGGEAMDEALSRYLCGIADAAWNLYGPTETTVWSSAARLAVDRPVTLGRPIANTQIHILDDQLRLVPRGAVGELHIGGEGLARGYLHQPALSAEKFIPNPYGEPGSRLYKTGDLARHLPDGSIEFLGRGDQQVKLRGMRIELGEIEAVLQASPLVREAAVAVHGDVPGDERLVAYVATHDHAGIQDILAHARQQLPAHMVPAQVVPLDALPRTPNGKLDRKALPAPRFGRSEAGEGYVAPRTPTEQALAAIWAEVLQQEAVGVHDDFFALGGHSLVAVQMVWRVRRQLAPGLSLSALLASPTVAALAARIGAAPLAHNPRKQGETT